MQIKSCGDSAPAAEDTRYQLIWETLEANRDLPRQGSLPAPSMLRVAALPSVK
jgi:hypothetical protein